MNQPSSNKPDNLAVRCQAYLRKGPPPHMTGYVSGSMLEIIIAHGAKSLALDPELRELGDLALQDAQDSVAKQQDQAVLSYLQRGADLLKEVLAT